MNIPEVVPFDASRLHLPEAAERLNHQDYDLVRELRAGSESAFSGFVERYQSKVRLVAYSFTRSREEADEIAQQVFVRVYFSIKGFEGRSSLFTWLHRITVNLCLEFLRKRKMIVSRQGKDCSQFSADRTPSSDKLVMQRDFIRKLLQGIPREDRHLILLREMEGYSINQLSSATGLKQSTVKTRLFRIRRRLLAASTQIHSNSVFGW
jgi:RNA polymerase sigma-70 factor (ECF subfamily)